MPHPEVQACESTQFPARPQSVAEITVVGQNPHRAFSVSTLQSKPGCAVRGWFGSPDLYPHVDTPEVICRRLRSRKGSKVDFGLLNCEASDASPRSGPAEANSWLLRAKNNKNRIWVMLVEADRLNVLARCAHRVRWRERKIRMNC
jgi:hypothetical protein